LCIIYSKSSLIERKFDVERFAEWTSTTVGALKKSFEVIANRADACSEGGDLENFLINYARSRMVRAQIKEMVDMEEDVKAILKQWEDIGSDDPIDGSDERPAI